jgi:endonuclease YncB( thermonuclease family)
MKRKPPPPFSSAGLPYYRRKRRIKRATTIVAALIGAGAVGGTAGFTWHLLERDAARNDAAIVYAEPLYGCSVTDGDTIRCGDERIRLLGIDAPELPGHCRSGRNCAPGDPYASTSSLTAA